jgi:hypothetical protein
MVDSLRNTVHKRHASRRHWWLRAEREGAYASVKCNDNDVHENRGGLSVKVHCIIKCNDEDIHDARGWLNVKMRCVTVVQCSLSEHKICTS